MGNERLPSLALMLIHFDKTINVDEVVKLFCQKQPQRKNFGTAME